MTPERAGLPRRPPSATGDRDGVSENGRRGSVRITLSIAAMVVAIAAIDMFASTRLGGIDMHLLYRRLYYIPIIYAAFVFGRRGGVVATLAALVPFMIQAQHVAGQPLALGFENWIEVVSFALVGVLFGKGEPKPCLPPGK